MNQPEVSLDSLFDGAMYCKQNREGYRFSLDSVLVAHFLLPHNDASVLDLGCGCGIIGLIIMYRWKALLSKVVGLEIQPALFQLANENRVLNGFEEKLSIVEGDFCNIKNYFQPEQFSHVICNPPFYKPSQGRGNTNQEAYIARHQILADLTAIAKAAKYCVKNKGRVIMIYPSEGMAELVHILRENKLEPKRIQYIYSRKENSAAKLILIECIKNGGLGVRVLQPFYVYQGRGEEYSLEMQKLYNV